MSRLVLPVLLAAAILALPAHAGRFPGSAAPASGNVAAQAAARFDVVGQTGGAAQTVAVSGDRLYVGVGTRIVVYDARDPLAPVALGQTEPLPGQVLDISVDGGLVYAVAGGLAVVDPADPAHPVLRGLVGIQTRRYSAVAAVVAGGGFAYVLQTGDGVAVVDARDPASPRVVAAVDVAAGANDLALSGHYLLVVDGCCWDVGPEAGLMVVDVAEPASPRVLADLDYIDFATAVAVHGDTALVSDAACAVRAIDLSTPETAVPGPCWVRDLPLRPSAFEVVGDRLYVLGRFDERSGLWVGDIHSDGVRWRLRYTPRTAVGLAVGDGTVWMAGGAQGLQGLRLDELADIGELGAVSLVGHPSRLTLSGGIAFVEGRVVVESRLVSMLQMVDVSDPAAPVVLGQINSLGPVAAVGRHLFVPVAGGIDVLDVTDPARPGKIGSAPLADTVTGLVVEGSYLVASGLIAGRCCVASFVQVWDISDPRQPTALGRAQGDWSAGVSVIHAGHVYIAGNQGPVKVIGIQDPTRPRQVASLDALGTVVGMAFDGTRAYFGESYGEVHAYDIADLTAPRMLWSRSDFGLTAIAIHEDRLWIAHGRNDGIRVLDIADPAGPFGVGLFEPERAFATMAVDGDRAFTVDVPPNDAPDPTTRLRVLDATRPGRLTRSNEPRPVPANADQVALAGDHVVIADRSIGLIVLDRADQPSVVGSLPLPYGAYAVVGDGRRAYVAAADTANEGYDWTTRLLVVGLDDPTRPVILGEASLPAEVVDLAAGGDLLVTYDGQTAHVYDAAAPGPLRLTGELALVTDWIAAAVVQGDQLYLVTGDKLRVADLTDPAAPRWTGHLALDGNPICTALAVAGNLAAVAISDDMNTSSVVVVDIGDPVAPRRLGTWTGGDDYIAGMAINGNRVIVTVESAVHVLDVADPGAPRQVAVLRAHGVPFAPGDWVSSLVAHGDHVWLAGKGAGLVVGGLGQRDLPVHLALPFAGRP